MFNTKRKKKHILKTIENKDHRIVIYVTPEERMFLKESAKKEGFLFAPFISNIVKKFIQERQNGSN